MKENKLWYDDPASDWLKALPLGNGRLGMMIYGGVNEDQIQLNEETFWTGWEYPGFDNPKTLEHLDEMRRLIFEKKYSEAQALCDKYFVCRGRGHHDSRAAFGAYQTAGDLYITVPNATEENYRRELCLNKGQVSVGCNNSQREYFVSPEYNVAVIKITGSTEDISLRYERENSSVIYDDAEIIAALSLLEDLCNYADSFRRTERPASDLVLGLKCGGSDGFLGITANPLLGALSDDVIAQGGSAILTEVPEMFVRKPC